MESVVARESLTLTEFLKARIAERESKAQDILKAATHAVERLEDPRFLGMSIPSWYAWPDIKAQAELDIRNVETEKALVETHRYETWTDWPNMGETYGDPVEVPYCRQCVAGADCEHCVYEEDKKEYRYCRIELLLAQPYSSHPDFNPEWKFPKEDTNG